MDERSFTIIVGGCFGVASVIISSTVSFLIARRSARGNTEKNLIDHFVRRTEVIEKAKERLTARIDSAWKEMEKISNDAERGMKFVFSLFEGAEQVFGDITHCIHPDAERSLSNLRSQVRSSRVRRTFLDRGLVGHDQEFGKHFDGEWLNDWPDILTGMETFIDKLRAELDSELRNCNAKIEGLFCTVLPKSAPSRAGV